MNKITRMFVQMLNSELMIYSFSLPQLIKHWEGFLPEAKAIA
jgi:hypothetical protein